VESDKSGVELDKNSVEQIIVRLTRKIDDIIKDGDKFLAQIIKIDQANVVDFEKTKAIISESQKALLSSRERTATQRTKSGLRKIGNEVEEKRKIIIGEGEKIDNLVGVKKRKSQKKGVHESVEETGARVKADEEIRKNIEDNIEAGAQELADVLGTSIKEKSDDRLGEKLAANYKQAQALVVEINNLLLQNKEVWNNDINDDVEDNLSFLKEIEGETAVDEQVAKIEALKETLFFCKKKIVEGDKKKIKEKKNAKVVKKKESGMIVEKEKEPSAIAKEKKEPPVIIKTVNEEIIAEIKNLESLNGEDLERHYWQKQGLSGSDIKNNQDIIQRRGLADGLNFQDWKEAELERLEKEIYKQEEKQKKLVVENRISEFNQQIDSIHNELNNLEKLRGIDLQIYYWEKRKGANVDLSTDENILPSDRGGLNFGDWQQTELERLYDEMNRLIKMRDEIHADIDSADVKKTVKSQKEDPAEIQPVKKDKQKAEEIARDLNMVIDRNQETINEVSVGGNKQEDVLDKEFDIIMDVLQGEGRRKSLEDLYEVARKAGTKKGTDLLSKIQEVLNSEGLVDDADSAGFQIVREANKSKKDKKRNLDMVPGWDEETATEVGVDGIEHNITPFKNEEELVSVFQDSDENFKSKTEVKSGPMQRRINIVSIDKIVRSYAQRAAENEVSRLVNTHQEGMESDTRTKRIWNTVTAILRRPNEFAKKTLVRMGEDGYRQAYAQSVIERITENQNLMLEIEGSYRLGQPLRITDGSLDVNYEILNKIISEHANNIQEQEEMGEVISNPMVNARFQELISLYCLSNDMPRDHFEMILRDEVAQMKADGLINDESFLGSDRVVSGERHDGFMYASNIFAVAQEYKRMIDSRIAEIKKESNLRPEQEEAVRSHIHGTLKLDIQLGSKMADLHNKQPLNNLGHLEQMISFMQTNPILRKIPINPGTLAIFASVAGNVATGAFGRNAIKTGTGLAIGTVAMTGALAPLLAAGLAAGTMAYFRRSKSVKYEKGMHKRNRTLGKDYTGKGRRDIYESFEYDTRSTTELTNELDALMAKGNYESLSSVEKEQVATMFARFNVELNREREFSIEGGENHVVDLISVDKEEGDRYGTNIISKTDLKIKLWTYLRDNALIARDGREMTNVDFENLVTASSFHFDTNINEANARFNSYRRTSSMNSAAIAGISAVAIGIGFQEGWAHISERINGRPEFTALDSVLHPEKLNQVYATIGEEQLTPGMHELSLKDSRGKEQVVKLFISEDGGLDVEASKLPEGWNFDQNSGKIIVPGYSEKVDIGNDIKAIATKIGTEQRYINYSGFFDHFTNPTKGLRALAETLDNLKHNLGLKSNKTELLMDFTANQDKSVNLDLTRMAGKILKGNGLNDHEISELIKRGGVKLNFAFDNTDVGKQLHPISIDVKDLSTKLPKELAQIFTSVDENGLVQTKGLITLTIDDGMAKNGATKVISIASKLQDYDGSFIKETIIDGVVYDINPGVPIDIAPAIGGSPVPRWALEGEAKKDEEDDKKTDSKPDNFNPGNIKIKSANDNPPNQAPYREIKIAESNNFIPDYEPVDEIINPQEIIDSRQMIVEKDLEAEFLGIMDERYGLKGEGRINSLNHLYNKARKLQSPFGSGLMKRIQVELEKTKIQIKALRENRKMKKKPEPVKAQRQRIKA
jgi:hypothetical protein